MRRPRPISRTLRLAGLLAVAALATAAGVAPLGGAAVEVLEPVFGLPAHLVNRFVDTAAVFAVSSSGRYVVLDRRDHAVYTFDERGNEFRRILEAGFEPGRVVQPVAISLGRDDILAVLDTPNGFDRVQYFSLTGMRVGGFYLPVRKAPRLSLDGVLIDPASALAFTGLTFLINQPEWGGLFTEFDADGQIRRQVGLQRRASPGTDPDVELALNIGLPVADPTGGFFFVFQTGVPLFRKYDEHGAFLYERHIEGPELDGRIRSLPTAWTARSPGTRPVVPPLVRAAAADARGRLWISLIVPYTYVYDGRGDKVRTLQLHAAGTLAPSSLFFTPQGRLLVGPGGYEFAAE